MSIEPLTIPWGKRVPYPLMMRTIRLCENLGWLPDWKEAPGAVLTCEAFETGEEFSAKTANRAGSGATGLIQFMPKTAEALGTTTEALAAMTEIEQMDYVEAYLRPYARRIHNLDDLYMAILWPAACGAPDDYVLRMSPNAYRLNSGLDRNKDGKITKAEACQLVREKWQKGSLPGNVMGYFQGHQAATHQVNTAQLQDAVDALNEAIVAANGAWHTLQTLLKTSEEQGI